MKPDNVLADDVLQAALNKWQGRVKWYLLGTSNWVVSNPKARVGRGKKNRAEQWAWVISTIRGALLHEFEGSLERALDAFFSPNPDCVCGTRISDSIPAERPEDCGAREITLDNCRGSSTSLRDYVIRRFNGFSAQGSIFGETTVKRNPPDPTGAPSQPKRVAYSKRLVRMVPGSVRRNWIAVNAVNNPT